MLSVNLQWNVKGGNPFRNIEIQNFVKKSDFLKDGFPSCEKILCESIMWFWRRIRSRFCPLLALARQGVVAEKRTSCHPTIHIYLHFDQLNVTFEQLLTGFSQLYVYIIDLI